MNSLTYKPRRVEALTPVEVSGRVLKAYVMFADDPGSDPDLPEPEWLRRHAATVLPGPPREGDHPVGFLILHHGLEGSYLLVSQWYDADMLKHWVRGAVAGPDGGTTFAPLAQHDLVACVWELKVIGFERDAWVDTVMAKGRLDGDVIDAYLGTTFSGWI